MQTKTSTKTNCRRASKTKNGPNPRSRSGCVTCKAKHVGQSACSFLLVLKTHTHYPDKMRRNKTRVSEMYSQRR